MISAPLPINENERIKALVQLDILDTKSEEVFDEITELASLLCDTPISLVSLIDTNRQWFKSKCGLDADESSREIAFCAHAILHDELLLVPDSLRDERFCDNPLVVDGPKIRFYAGMPLKASSGHNVGTLCVIDSKPRELSEKQIKALKVLSRQVVTQMELRVKIRETLELTARSDELLADLTRKNEELDHFAYIVSHDLKAPLRAISSLSTWIREDIGESFSDDTNMHFDLLQSRVLRLEKMIEGILRFCRLGTLEKTYDKVNVSELIHETWEALSYPKGSRIEVDALPALVCTPLALQQIMQNLLSNSIKYNDKEAVSIHVSHTTTEDFVEYIIEDNGPGIKEEYRAKVFEVFQTLNARDEVESTGIGLAIVLKLMLATDGEVRISGEENEGVKVHLKWPIEMIADESDNFSKETASR